MNSTFIVKDPKTDRGYKLKLKRDRNGEGHLLNVQNGKTYYSGDRLNRYVEFYYDYTYDTGYHGSVSTALKPYIEYCSPYKYYR